MNKIIRIALADTSAEKISSLKGSLLKVTNYRVLVEALNGTELIRKLRKNPVDIMLINFKMPVINGTKSLEEFKTSFPDLRIVLISLYNDPLLIWTYLSKGINGILLKQFETDQIYQTIDEVLHKGYYCSDRILNALSRAKVKPLSSGPEESNIKFSKIELAIINCICMEMTSNEIAEKLFISKRTIDWYRREIMNRIQAKTSIGLVKYAISNGYFDCDNKKNPVIFNTQQGFY